MEIDNFLLNKEDYRYKSKITNSTIFFGVLLAFFLGFLVSVYIWPENDSVLSQRFWLTTFAIPIGASTAIAASLIGYRKMEVTAANQDDEDNRAAAMAAAGRPLALLGASYRYTTSPSGDDIDTIESGSLSIPILKNFADGSEPMRGRWFDTSFAFPRQPKEWAVEEFDRHTNLSRWLLEILLKELAPQIAKIPPGVRCVAHLHFSSRLYKSANMKCWEEVASYVLLRLFPVVYQETDAKGVLSFDKWLDDAISQTGEEARLIIAIQLQSVRAPPWVRDGSTEAASALLVMSDALAEKHGLKKQADLHRPVTSTVEKHVDAVRLAMRIARTTGKRIAKVWQIGIPLKQIVSLSVMNREAEVVAPVIDIDRTVGAAGVAAPWFAVACAHALLQKHGGTQMVTAGSGDKVSTLILKPTQKNTRGVSR